jgi:tocopherol O-methyltransferase
MLPSAMRKEIADYYDRTFFDYFFGMNLWKHWGLHYGYYDTTHTTAEDACVNMNIQMAHAAKIKKGMRVLDAGCGVGGSSVWLAKNIGAHVVGITLSSKQLEQAKKLSKQFGVEDKTEFYIRDYTDTKFPKESFDIVWGLESICYAPDKKVFLKEAKRLLKPGGTVVVADGFMLRDPQDAQEEKLVHDLWRGWALDNMASLLGFKKDLEKTGFSKIHMKDISANVRPFSEWLYKRGRLFNSLAKMRGWIQASVRKMMNPDQNHTALLGGAKDIAAVLQYKAVTKGLCGYGIFTATKS